jgi:universal stress protein A
MEEVKRILVLSRSTKSCGKAVRYGLSLAKKYDCEMYVLHIIHNPFGLEGWNVPIASLKELNEEYERIQEEARADLNRMVEEGKAKGIPVQVMVREGHPNKELFKVIEDERIDLLILLAHEEWRLEHILFGRANDEIIRRMPCSVMLVKQEPKAAPDGDSGTEGR